MPAHRGVKYRCPVCKCKVEPTMRHNIQGHLNRSGKVCDAVGEPFQIALKEYVK